MTRDWFYDNVNTWSDLIDVIHEHELREDFDIISNYDMWDEVREMMHNYDDWEDYARWLGNIPTGYEYYDRDDYSGLSDDDFDDWKERLYEAMSDNDDFDDDDDDYDDNDDESYDYESEELEEDVYEQEDFTVSALISMCHADISTVSGEHCFKSEPSANKPSAFDGNYELPF